MLIITVNLVLLKRFDDTTVDFWLDFYLVVFTRAPTYAWGLSILDMVCMSNGGNVYEKFSG